MTRVARVVAVVVALGFGASGRLPGQEAEVERPAPPALDDFESDANRDGVPDGWYNARDVVIAAEGGKVGAHCLKFETRKPGRPSRLSRAFGVDGRTTEALLVGLWVRLDQVQTGERLGEDPALMIDFLGAGLRALRRGTIGPWTKAVGAHWTHVAKRIPVPPETRDAIMSVGLLGASGVLEVDGLTIELVPVGGRETTNLVNNGDFELGDPAPTFWLADGGAHRTSPGARSTSALELSRSGARALTGLAIPVEPFAELEVVALVKAKGLRGGGGAAANFFFLDAFGEIVTRAGGGVPVFRWAGTFDWQRDRVAVAVPRGAVRAVLQFEKSDNTGSLWVDDVAVRASPDRTAGAWIPDHVEEDTTGWHSVQASPAIAANSALDASFLATAPAGKRGFITVKDGRLAFSKGGRARFFGVQLLAPTAFQDRGRAEALAERLARSGINLVRLGDLDTPLGPDRSLYEDSRDDTKAFDPVALAKLDHLIAALKARGVYIALELQSTRRFRSEDGVAHEGALPLGGGPAAEFDPAIAALQHASAKALLEHVNPETGLALRDDPVLAWVTLAGELSLFDLLDNPAALPTDYAAKLRALAATQNTGGGRRLWQAIGAAHWKELAEALRQDRLRVPVAGVSHWRRDPEFAAAQGGEGLDLIDDRLYWMPPAWIGPDRRSLLWSLDGGLAAGAARKRKADRPYVVGQWCSQTQGAWALPYEGADLILASGIAAAEDWDALVRRGVFIHPEVWGADAAGTGGGEDIFQIPEVVNGIPQVFALLPHAASLMLRGTKASALANDAPHPNPTRSSPRPKTSVAGWNPAQGRYIVDTPYTQGVAGWAGDQPASFAQIAIETENPYAVVLASSATTRPIASTPRLLVSAIGRVVPRGLRYADEWKREVADPGQPPLLQEPVQARVLWRRKGDVKAFALDNTGARVKPVPLQKAEDGFELAIDPTSPTIHWELIAE